GDERHYVSVEALHERHPAAVRRDLEFGRVLAGQVRVLVLAVEADRDELALPLAGVLEQVDAVALGAEAGLLPLRGDQRGLAAGRGHAVDPRLQRPGRGADESPLDLAVDDLLAVRREGRLHVLPRLLDHDPPLAAGGRRHPYGAELVL